MAVVQVEKKQSITQQHIQQLELQTQVVVEAEVVKLHLWLVQMADLVL